jgi:hypothetical protein
MSSGEQESQSFEMDEQINKNAFHDIDTTIRSEQSGVTVEKETAIRTPYYTTYPWKQSNGEKLSIPIPIRWHPLVVVKNIINHNKLSGGYTGIVEIGMSGAGKTTITKMIIHFIHKIGETYIVRKFSGADMLNIDKIIASCVPGIPHIIVLDDASYVLQDAKKSDVSRLANALTTIRHQIKSRVIVIMNIHYSKAMLKFFRNQHFTFLVSVTPEELGNYSELFKGDMQTIHEFSRLYRSMYTKGYFRLPISTYDGTYLKYRTNDPFRICLVAEFTDLHYMLFPSERCDQCDPEEAELKAMDMEQIADYIYDRWGYRGGDAVRLKAFIETGDIRMLPAIDRRVWEYLTKVSRQMKVDFKALAIYSLSNKKIRRQRAKMGVDRNQGTRADMDNSIAGIMEDLKIRDENPELYELNKKIKKVEKLQAEIAAAKLELGNDGIDDLPEPELATVEQNRAEYGKGEVVTEEGLNGPKYDNSLPDQPGEGSGIEDNQ